MSDSFARRRRRALEKVGRGAILVPSAPESLRNGDVHYPYRPNSDLYYLTGLREPDSALLLRAAETGPESVLFVRPREREIENWTGFRTGLDGARRIYGAGEAYPIGELSKRLPDLLEGIDTLHFSFGVDPAIDKMMTDLVSTFRGLQRSGGTGPTTLVDAAEILHEMRLRKDVVEIDTMSRAAQISAQAHCEALQRVGPGLFEYEIQAVIEYEFRRRGADGCSYPSIVASGPNACTLHYQSNNRQMLPDDLLLIDAGAEYELYAADITRTCPVSGRFTPDQAALYDIVLEAQTAAIQAALPGSSLQSVHQMACTMLVEGLLRIGILQGDLEEILRTGRYQAYTLHPTSHWLGLDVHDAGRYVIGESRLLEPGMILTIEPGLYLFEDNLEIDPRFRGIGIRIEDDLLITMEGNQILTKGVPKEREEIESLMAQHRGL
ncbi:MAG: aminopeptidase P N-terminal domain-containing protein [Candidatus Eisenbacteria bacterium]|uniref:Xaa-Pro aminopeptidase n=1 Tax=Eiseniibacteriota bacterium TaxID=2212470 RepID=A0A948W6C6_UNCEI|nr:aminopeptidase P N-terminal domain-containing protein [Candidatus Eisenbacteria bacterium]MBU1947223.1 aminopeptidase P N-terminal domain-containing protein [Candidatus Eisenbacteria bacterium]MBU2690506.1 aminopeptidase P N-terminal domain-containing protein [Candidatus Eisenbacteria bacterium]